MPHTLNWLNKLMQHALCTRVPLKAKDGACCSEMLYTEEGVPDKSLPREQKQHIIVSS